MALCHWQQRCCAAWCFHPRMCSPPVRTSGPTQVLVPRLICARRSEYCTQRGGQLLLLQPCHHVQTTGVRVSISAPWCTRSLVVANEQGCHLQKPTYRVPLCAGRCDAQQDYLDQQMAVHAAGVMLTTLTAAHCRDIVVCCHRKPLGAPSAELQVSDVAPPMAGAGLCSVALKRVRT